MKLLFRHSALKAPSVIQPTADGLGIENVKIILTVLITFLVDLITVFRGGSWISLAQTLFSLVRYGNIVTIASEAWREFKDLDLDEARALNDHFAAEFDLEDDAAEKLIEEAVAIVPQVYELALDAVAIGERGLGLWNKARGLFAKDGTMSELSKIVPMPIEPKPGTVSSDLKLGKGRKAS